MALLLRIGTCSLTGRPTSNKDALAVRRLADAVVCVVADGASWSERGERASQLAVEALPRELEKYIPGVFGTEETKGALRRALLRTNEEVVALGRPRELWDPVASVVLSLWFTGSPLMYVTNVGDARAYRVCGNTIAQLTADHSVAQALVEAGTITASEASASPWRNVMLHYLGAAEVGEGSIKVVQMQPGDRYLLCTKGLSYIVPPDQIRAFMASTPDAQQCAEGLCRLALEQGSRCNVSAIVIDVVA
jgi:protein phosphatase